MLYLGGLSYPVVEVNVLRTTILDTGREDPICSPLLVSKMGEGDSDYFLLLHLLS